MQAIINNPAENIFVLPGDVITAIRQPLTYTAFGATGRNAVIPFDQVEVSTEEAIAKAGGMLDYQADPDGVFIFRFEPVSLARQLDPTRVVQPGARGAEQDDASLYGFRNPNEPVRVCGEM